MKLKKISLSSFAQEELKNRELRSILGGENCCICTCSNQLWNSLDGGNGAYSRNDGDGAGYGSGSFGAPK